MVVTIRNFFGLAIQYLKLRFIHMGCVVCAVKVATSPLCFSTSAEAVNYKFRARVHCVFLGIRSNCARAILDFGTILASSSNIDLLLACLLHSGNY